MGEMLRSGASFLIDALRTLAAFLDGVVYALVSLLYRLFFDVSGARIIQFEHIKTLFQNFQLIVLVVALFAIAVSVIKYIIDPDKVNEKSNPDNASKLVSRIVVTFILLLTVNTIFSFAYRLQDAVIENGFISKLILGRNIADSDIDNMGVAFSESILRAFITDNPDAGAISKQNNIQDADDFFRKIVSYQGFYIIMPEYINDKDDEENYILDYLPIISTLVGGFIGYILLTYVIGVAVRVIQLVYLQIIAPVPILMNVTPGGKDRLMVWVRQCVTTYIDLFIRHLVIYLTLFLCSVILTEGVDTKYNFSDNQNVLTSNYSYLDNVDTRMVAYADSGIDNLGMLNNNSDIISDLQNETLNIDDNSNYSVNTIQLANSTGSSSNSSDEKSETFVKIAIVIGIMVFARKAPSLIMELFPSTTKASGNYGLNLKEQLSPATSMLSPVAGVVGGVAGATGALLAGGPKSIIKGMKSGGFRKGFAVGMAAEQDRINKIKEERMKRAAEENKEESDSNDSVILPSGNENVVSSSSLETASSPEVSQQQFSKHFDKEEYNKEVNPNKGRMVSKDLENEVNSAVETSPGSGILKTTVPYTEPKEKVTYHISMPESNDYYTKAFGSEKTSSSAPVGQPVSSPSAEDEKWVSSHMKEYEQMRSELGDDHKETRRLRDELEKHGYKG